MKKLRKSLLSIFAFCLLIPCMFLFSACGEKDPEPYNVAGSTISVNAECVVVWKKGVTDAEKQQAYDELCSSNPTKAGFDKLVSDINAELEMVVNEDGGMSVTFNKDKTVNVSSKTYYYEQSKDLKTINIYKEAEKTDIFEQFVFINGFYCQKVAGVEDIVTIYYTFSK